MIELNAFKSLLAFLLRDFISEYGNFLHVAYKKTPIELQTIFKCFLP